MKLEHIECADCHKQFEHPRAERQRGRPPKYCRKCRVLRALAPRRCESCRRQQVLSNCQHKEQK